MANSILIKRQTGQTAAPTQLLYGELAVDEAGTLYVGNKSNVPTQCSGGGGAVGYNILDNTDTDNIINQWGTSNNTVGGYLCDRWEKNSGQPYYSSANKAFYMPTNAVIRQGFPTQYFNDFSKNYTFSCLVDGVKTSVTGPLPAINATGTIGTSSDGKITVTFYRQAAVCRIMIKSLTQNINIKYPKFEIGDEATDWQPKGYVQELNVCLQYVKKYTKNCVFPGVVTLDTEAMGDTGVKFQCGLTQPMIYNISTYQQSDFAVKFGVCGSYGTLLNNTVNQGNVAFASGYPGDLNISFFSNAITEEDMNSVGTAIITAGYVIVYSMI